MITTNVKKLKKLNACHSGFSRFVIATKGTDNDVNIIDLIGTEVGTSDLIWLACKVLPKKKIIQFAIDCAESAVHLSTDKELAQNCIDAAKAVLLNNTAKNRKSAEAAVEAAVEAPDCSEYANWVTCKSAVFASNSAFNRREFDIRAYATSTAYVVSLAADGKFDVNPLLVKLFTK